MNPIPKEEVYKKRKKTVSQKGCADCNSMCCHDLVMEIEAPSNEDDITTLMWYLHFKHSYIFIHNNRWYHMIRSECRFLDKTSMLCGIYEKRSARCREHKSPNCERYEAWYDKIFDHPYTLEKYIREDYFIKDENKRK